MIPLRKLHPEAPTPKRATPNSAAYDLFYFSPYDEPAIIHQGDTVTLGTGIALALDQAAHTHTSPHGERVEYAPCRHRAALILPRSGAGCRGLRPGNTPGLIDPDYRGELLVCLRNESTEVAFIRSGERIAQLLFIPYLVPDFYLLDEDYGWPETERGTGGFGSTGR